MSEVLRKRGVKHVVLNAKFHERESEIVAQAGRLGAVTIATNMAGRGTDIVLGGNPEMLAKAEVAKNPELDFETVFAKFVEQCAEEKKKVLELGGLCIIGTERHDSRRIDNQLRGRAGRQGDPGLSQFYLSMEDDLMRIFGNERMKKILLASMEPGVPIEHRMVNRAIERAQKSKENQNFEARKHLLEYDDVMNKQRTTFYRMRRELLGGEPREYLFSRLQAIVKYSIEDWAENPQSQEPETRKEIADRLNPIFNLNLSPEDFIDKDNDENFKDELLERIQNQYQEKWDSLGLDPEQVKNHERFLMLYMLDQQWKDHMRSMDHLKQGISLQGYAQKDPLIEYKKASYSMFNDLMDRMDEEVVKMLVLVQPRLNDESVERMRRQRQREAEAMRMQGAQDQEEAKQNKTVRRAQPKVGRNDPCHCGSGKKFKHCHGR
jgi:preprotein translocase subunit SecA